MTQQTGRDEEIDYCKCEKVTGIIDGTEPEFEGNYLDGTFKITYSTFSRCFTCNKDIEPDYKRLNIKPKE